MALRPTVTCVDAEQWKVTIVSSLPTDIPLVGLTFLSNAMGSHYSLVAYRHCRRTATFKMLLLDGGAVGTSLVDRNFTQQIELLHFRSYKTTASFLLHCCITSLRPCAPYRNCTAKSPVRNNCTGFRRTIKGYFLITPEFYRVFLWKVLHMAINIVDCFCMTMKFSKHERNSHSRYHNINLHCNLQCF